MKNYARRFLKGLVNETRSVLIGLGVVGAVGGGAYVAMGSPSRAEMQAWVMENMYEQEAPSFSIAMPTSAAVPCARNNYECRLDDSLQGVARLYFSRAVDHDNNFRMSVPVSLNPDERAGWAVYDVSYSEGRVHPNNSSVPVTAMPQPSIAPTAYSDVIGYDEIKSRPQEQVPQQEAPQVPPVVAPNISVTDLRCVFAQAQWTNGSRPPQDQFMRRDVIIMANGRPVPEGYHCGWGI